MNVKYIISIFVLSLLSINILSCQIDLDRIAKKAQRSVNNRIERNVDRSIDNAMDNAEDSLQKKKKKKGKNGEEDYEPEVEVRVVKEVIPNSFQGKFMMNRSYSEDGNSSSNMIYVQMNEYQTAVRPLIIKEPHNLIIFDKQEETVVTINNTNYAGKAMKDWYSSDMEDEDDEFSTATKTSDIKEIQGYISRKYEVAHDDYTGIVWFTKEIDASVSTIYNIMEYSPLHLDQSLGFPLEMTIKYEDGSEEELSIKDISEYESDQSLFDISEYELIDMTDLKVGK
jgi:hypothetical protein